jgi:GNAT superfamily N-acetyltransferase
VPTAETIAHLDAHWAAQFGCDPAVLHRPGVSLLRSAGDFADYHGVYLLRWGEACVFTVPAPFYARVAAGVAGRGARQVFDRAFLERLLGEAVDCIIGPAFRGCCDTSDFRPVVAPGARLLAAADESALRALAVACEAQAWEHSGIKFDRPPHFGYFEAGELVAAGMLQAASTRLRNVGIITHPTRRGWGYGRALISFMTAYALAAGGIGHYQTLMSNMPAKAGALALGYQQYATGLAVRLRPPTEGS